MAKLASCCRVVFHPEQSNDMSSNGLDVISPNFADDEGVEDVPINEGKTLKHLVRGKVVEKSEAKN